MRRIICSIILLTVLAGISFAQEFDPQFDRANTLIKWKYYDDAIVQLGPVIDAQKEPYSGRAKFLKAICYLKKDKLDDASRIFQQLVDEDHILKDYIPYLLGLYHFDRNEFNAAKDHFNSVSTIFQDSALVKSAKIKEAECYVKLNDPFKASKILESYIEMYPTDQGLDEAVFDLAKCYEKKRAFRNAFDQYGKISLYFPLSKHLREANGRIRFLKGAYGLTTARDTDKTLYDKAMIFYNRQDFGSAAMFFGQIVSNYRTSELYDKALMKLGLCYYKRARFKLALSYFKASISRNSSYADEAQFYAAFTYGKRGYFNEALTCFIKVIQNYPGSSYKDDALYYLGYYHETNNFKDIALQYYQRLIAECPDSSYIDDAHLRVGKLCFFKGEYGKALESFDSVVKSIQTGDMSNECAYWKALTLEKMGRKVEAIFAYRYVIDRFDHTYYSYRARKKLELLGISAGEIRKGEIRIAGYDFSRDFFEAPPYKVDLSGELEPFPLEVMPSDEAEVQESNSGSGNFLVIDLKEHFKKYAELMSMNLFDQAKLEAEYLLAGSPRDKKQPAKLALSASLLGSGKYREAIVIAEDMCNSSVINGVYKSIPEISWYLSYPKGYFDYVKKYSEIYGVDPYLVLAVIREESRFNPQTLSWANAHGLMQVIPKTGIQLARSLRIKPYYSRRLYEPEMNIKMGCYYLANLIKKFGGNHMLALAAYNGGPTKVNRWLNGWKNKPGEYSNIDDFTDEFVEGIPLSETKRYVQKVLKSYNEYKRIYLEPDSREKETSMNDFLQYHD